MLTFSINIQNLNSSSVTIYTNDPINNTILLGINNRELSILVDRHFYDHHD